MVVPPLIAAPPMNAILVTAPPDADGLVAGHPAVVPPAAVGGAGRAALSAFAASALGGLVALHAFGVLGLDALFPTTHAGGGAAAFQFFQLLQHGCALPWCLP